MPVLEGLFPRRASNDYRGRKVALYAFGLLALGMGGRSLVHLFKGDSGVNSIATILTFSGTPDPNNVIYLYSALWGSQQLVMVLVYAVVLWRYRNLVPLMYALMLVELCLRRVAGTLHPLTPEYYLRTPPGMRGAIPLFVLSALLLYLSLPRRDASGPDAPDASDAAP